MFGARDRVIKWPDCFNEDFYWNGFIKDLQMVAPYWAVTDVEYMFGSSPFHQVPSNDKSRVYYQIYNDMVNDESVHQILNCINDEITESQIAQGEEQTVFNITLAVIVTWNKLYPFRTLDQVGQDNDKVWWINLCFPMCHCNRPSPLYFI